MKKRFLLIITVLIAACFSIFAEEEHVCNTQEWYMYHDRVNSSDDDENSSSGGSSSSSSSSTSSSSNSTGTSSSSSGATTTTSTSSSSETVTTTPSYPDPTEEMTDQELSVISSNGTNEQKNKAQEILARKQYQRENTRLSNEGQSIIQQVRSVTHAVVELAPATVPTPDSENSVSVSIKNEQVQQVQQQEEEKKEAIAAKVPQNKTQIKNTENTKNSEPKGDPVLVSEGIYEQKESDIGFSQGEGFYVTRRYASNCTWSSSFGYGWMTNLDQRIILGTEPAPQESYQNYQTYSQQLRQIILEYETQLAQYYGVESIYEAENIYNERRQLCVQALTQQAACLENAQQLFLQAQGYEAQEEIACHIEEIQTSIQTIQEKKGVYEEAITQIQNHVQTLSDFKQDYQRSLELLNQNQPLYDLSLLRKERNALAMAGGVPLCYEETGLDTITFIDEEGYPHIFTKESDRSWKSDNKKYISCQTEAKGFKLLEYGGVEKHFDSNGFLIKIADRNSNEIVIKRDSDEKIDYIQNSFGERFKFGYNGSFIRSITNVRDNQETVLYSYKNGKLVSVTDTGGDTVLIDYDSSGRLTTLTKCDGSCITISYGEITSDGKILTTATTNEEGFSENFFYDRNESKTIYTDHDGNKTICWYDKHHRTIRQQQADGSLIETFYNEDETCIKVNQNGFNIEYTYDLRGNLLCAVYDNDSVERWTYDSFGLETSYIDRDGVFYEFLRDSKGNLLEAKVGGKTVFVQQVNNHGFVVQKTVYGQNPVRTDFAYDSYGNLCSMLCGGIKTEYKYDGRNRLLKKLVDEKLVSEYEYKGYTIIQKDYNGLETSYILNGRKDINEIIQKDGLTGTVHKTRIEYDKRHLPLKFYTGDGMNEELTASYSYTKEGKLRTQIQHGKETLIKQYEYKNGVVCEIVSTFLESTSAVSELVEGHTEQHSTLINTTIAAENQRLIRLTDELGNESLFEYDNFGNLIKQTDANGNSIGRLYSKAGRLYGEQSDFGGWYDYSYGSDGLMNKSSERRGLSVTAQYYADGSLKSQTDCYGNTSIYNYDIAGRISSVQNENQKLWYDYDSLNRLTKLVVGNSNDITNAIYYRTFEYSADGRKVSVIEGGKYKTIYELDAFGNIIKQTDGNGNSRCFEYDVKNQRTASIDAYGNKTLYEYNVLGAVSQVQLPDGTKTKYEYNYQGLLTKVVDECGVVYSAVYDKVCRLIKERNRGDCEKSYEYDKGGRITKVVCGGEVIEAYVYSKDNRRVIVKDGNGNDYTYNYDGFGRLVKEINRQGYVQQYFYDEQGQLKNQTCFDGSEVTISFSNDRRVQKVSYSDGSENRFVYDAAGNIIEAQNAYGKTLYEYDKGGRLVHQKDESSGEEVIFEYDAAGNRTRLLCSNREIIYSYGKNNEILEVFDNMQRMGLSFEYDSNGQETKRTFLNGIIQETFYDKAGRIILITQKAQRGELLWAEGYVYGADGKRTATIDNKAQLTFYEYNKQGKLCVVWYPYSKELEQNLKVQANENGLPAMNNLGENRFLTASERSALVLLLDKMQYGLSAALSNLQIFAKESFDYDKNGNRVTKINSYGSIHYSYDCENRLVFSGTDNKTGVKYTYDRNGNLLTEESELKTKKYAYNSQNRLIYCEVTDKAAKSYAQTDYAYDSFGRRVLVQDNNEAALYTLYDGFSFDVIKTSPVFTNGLFTDSNQTGICWTNTGKPTGDRYRYLDDGDAQDSNRYYYLDEENYKLMNSRYLGWHTNLCVDGTVAAQSSAEGTLYFSTDLLGSIRAKTDNSGLSKSNNTYDAFGSLIQGELSGSSDYGYLSKPYDPTASLYNYGFRDYNPLTSRFTTSDPIRDGTNWFSYCSGDPVNFVDLWGLCVTDAKSIDDYINEYNISTSLPTNVRKLIGQFYKNKEMNITFSEKVTTFVGTSYVYGGKDRTGIDCSGLVTCALNEMGYEVDTVNTNQMVSGLVDWIEIFPYASNEKTGDTGMLNFYKIGESKKVNHVNIGVGSVNTPRPPYIYTEQIVDATEGSTLNQRDGRGGQYITPKEGRVNQTYSPFSTNTNVSVQGKIKWDVLEEKYKK